MFYQVIDEYNVCEKCGDEKFPIFKIFTDNEKKEELMYCEGCCKKFFSETSESERKRISAIIYEHEIFSKFYHNAGNSYFIPSDHIPSTKKIILEISRKYISNTIEYKNIYEYINEILLTLIYNKEVFHTSDFSKGIFGLQFVFNLYKNNELFDNNRFQEFESIYLDYLSELH